MLLRRLPLLALIVSLPVLAGTHRDVLWSATDPTERLTIDAPATPGPHPLLIWLRDPNTGGAAERQFSTQAERLLAHGYVLVSVPPPALASYPDTLKRYAEIIAQVYRHSAEINADPSRMVLLGAGAAAHAAALLSVDPRWLQGVRLSPKAFNGVVLLDADSLDLPARMRRLSNAERSRFERFGSNPQSWQEVSPLAQVRAAATPPLLLISSAATDALSQESIEQFRDRLRAIGTASAFIRLPAADAAGSVEGDDPLLPWLSALTLDRVNRLENMDFAVDFAAGQSDADHPLASGEAVPFLVNFDGRLLAAVNAADRGLGEHTRLLEKTSTTGAWQWRDEFPGKISHLAVIEHRGNAAAATDSARLPLLLLGLHRNDDAGVAPIFWRAAASDWRLLADAPASALAATLLHHDRALGHDVLLLGFAGVGIRAAEIDGALPTLSAQYELNGANVVALVNANGDAYALISGANAGLYRRVDGLAPSWRRVAALPSGGGATPVWAALAAVPDPSGSATENLLVSENGDGRIWRLDPAHGFRRHLEFTVTTAFAAIWPQAPSQISFGNQQWTALTQPETGDQVQAIGLGMQRLGGSDASQRGAWYLLRQDSASYSYGLVYDYQSPLVGDEKLATVRAIAPSPFPDDQGRSFYFGGFAAGSDDGDGAWIYRAQLPQANIQPGLWWDKSHSGHGIDLQAVGARWRILLSSYDADGRPIWYTALGSIDGQNFHADDAGLTRYHYAFDQDPPQRRDPARSGSVALRFGLGADDPVCAASGIDRRGALALAELSLQIDGNETHWCIEPMHWGDGGQSPVNVNGLWAAGADDANWALTLAAQGRGHAAQEVATLYYFDGSGEPRWAQGSAPALNGNAMFTLSSFTAACPGCAPVPASAQPVGTLSHQFSGACAEVTGTASIDLSDPDGRGNRFLRSAAALTAVSRPACY